MNSVGTLDHILAFKDTALAQTQTYAPTPEQPPARDTNFLLLQYLAWLLMLGGLLSAVYGAARFYRERSTGSTISPKLTFGTATGGVILFIIGWLIQYAID